MPRRLRNAVGGMFFHVLNRAAGRAHLFRKDNDYAAFLRVVGEVHARLPTRVLSYCVMSNHWHFVMWPREDGELSEFMRLLTVTHTQRWHAWNHSAGSGPLYQGRFKSFPIERDDHLISVCRFVERNALRSGLVRRAEQWRWGSLWARENANREDRDGETGRDDESLGAWLMPWEQCPVELPPRWSSYVNRPQSPAEEAAIVESIRRGRPYGDASWQAKVAAKLGLESSLRPRGRPRLRHNQKA